MGREIAAAAECHWECVADGCDPCAALETGADTGEGGALGGFSGAEFSDRGCEWGALGIAVMGLWLLAAPTAAALVLAVWYLFLTRLVGDAAFRRDLGMGLLAATLVILLQVLLGRLL